ncbi:MAG: 4-hydroxy-tetrahydrodipicolinate reductase, partial [Treponema sp.]|nr:4-hydroxy-tetrahydrodipicolinate reductase [Treponema sp.]
FSIGVNMFYKIVEEAVKIMQPFTEYDISTWEMHHNQKVDSPSGTAIEIAKRILENDSRKTEMVVDAFHERPKANELHVSSTRGGCVPGTHTVFIDSAADTIELTHRARSREGFAMGSVHALERLANGIKTGSLVRGKLYGMKDLF